MLPRRALATNLDALADAWEWTGEDVVAHGLPLFHVHGLILGMLGPLRRGGGAYHLGKFSTEAAAEALRRARDGAVRRPDDVPPDGGRPREVGRRWRKRSARRACSSPAPPRCPPPTTSGSRRAPGLKLVERYGMSETLMNTAIRADGDRRAGHGGRAAGRRRRCGSWTTTATKWTSPTTRPSARSRSAARTSSSSTSTARTRRRRR